MLKEFLFSDGKILSKFSLGTKSPKKSSPSRLQMISTEITSTSIFGNDFSRGQILNQLDTRYNSANSVLMSKEVPIYAEYHPVTEFLVPVLPEHINNSRSKRKTRVGNVNMATKKKFPQSRRSRKSLERGLYTSCLIHGEAESVHYNKSNCETNQDYPDRVKSKQIATCKTLDKQDVSDSFQRFDSINEDEDEVRYDRGKQTDNEGTIRLYTGPEFECLDVLVALASIAFFYFDIVTDILLARDYYKQNNMLAFGLTTSFIIGPSIITCILNFRWYLLDYETQKILIKKRGKGNVKVTSLALWCVRFVMTVSFMGPVIRQMEYIYNGIKSNSRDLAKEERKRHYVVMRMEDVDASCIRMFECFLEAAPQLVLQIYILMTHRQDEPWLTAVIRGAAIISSWLSLSWSLVAYQNALRYSHEDKENMKIPGMIFYFLWRACEIGPRVIALGLFWSQFKYLAFIVLGAHWVFMSSWLFCQKTRFHQNRCEEKFFNIICGYVLIFCFLNVRDGRTRYRMLVFYFILYLENWSMMGFWFYFTDDKSEWFYLPAFFVVSLSVFAHLFFQLLYYGCFHPLGAGKIPCCPPRGEYFCYQSLCHDLNESDNEYYIESGPVPASV